MLTLGIFLGLFLGLAAGGSLTNLASIRLRWIWALSLAVVVRFLTEPGQVQPFLRRCT